MSEETSSLRDGENPLSGLLTDRTRVRAAAVYGRYYLLAGLRERCRLAFPFRCGALFWYLGRRVRVLVFLNFAYCLFLKYSKAPDPRWGSRGMAMAAPPCCLALAWLHGEYSPLSARSVSLLTNIAVRAWRQCSTQALPIVGCLLTLKMSDSQEGRTILNAHARDWEHAETVRRRCLGAVGGFALRVECTDPGACG